MEEAVESAENEADEKEVEEDSSSAADSLRSSSLPYSKVAREMTGGLRVWCCVCVYVCV